jgi:hypothetical protein
MQQEYVGTARLVWVSAVKCAGRFDLALFDTPGGQLIDWHLSRDTVANVLDAHCATSTAQFRRWGSAEDKDPATIRRSGDREHSLDDDVCGLDGVRDGDSVRRVNLDDR